MAKLKLFFSRGGHAVTACRSLGADPRQNVYPMPTNVKMRTLDKTLGKIKISRLFISDLYVPLVLPRKCRLLHSAAPRHRPVLPMPTASTLRQSRQPTSLAVTATRTFLAADNTTCIRMCAGGGRVTSTRNFFFPNTHAFTRRARVQ